MAEETKRAAYTVPRAMLGAFFIGCATNFALLVSYLFSITNMNNAAIPGYGITGSCPTINQGTLDYQTANNGALPAWGGLPFGMAASGFGDLPPWSTNAFPGAPNDGVPLITADGGCVLSNGLPFSYSPVGNIFYDAFAARFPRCTPDEAFGPATWALDANGVLVDTGVETGTYNVNQCWPLNTPADVLNGAKACCDITGAIAPTDRARGGAIFFLFLIFIGTLCAFPLPPYGYCGCCLHALNACAIHPASRSHRDAVLRGRLPLHLQLRARPRLPRLAQQDHGVRGAAHQGASGLHLALLVARHRLRVLLDQREPHRGLRRCHRVRRSACALQCSLA